MRLSTLLVGLSCLAPAMGAPAAEPVDNTKLFRGLAQFSGQLVPATEAFLESPEDRKKATAVFNPVKNVWLSLHLESDRLFKGKFESSDCEVAVPLFTQFSDNIVNASPLLMDMGGSPKLSKWVGGSHNLLKGDFESFLSRASSLGQNGPDFNIPRALVDKCGDQTLEINRAADAAKAALKSSAGAFA